MNRCPAVLLALTLLAEVSPGQLSIFSPAELGLIREGQDAIYNLEHDRAIEIYQGMIKKSPADPLGYAYLAKTYWLQELVTKQELSIDRFASSDFFAESPRYHPEVDPAIEARFLAANQQAIDRGEARLEVIQDDPRSLFVLGLAYQNRASFEASLKRSWWASFRSGTKTYRLQKQLLERDPHFLDAYLGVGVFHYVTGRLGWDVKWLALLLGYQGSTERGLAELRQAAEGADLASADARVILTLIYTREKRFQNAFDELTILLKRYPKNYLIHLDMGGIALLMERPAAAIAIYQDILRNVSGAEPKYRELDKASVENRLGVAFRAQRNLPESVEWLRRALAEPGSTLTSQIVSHLELGKTYDQLGQRNQALEHYRRVLAMEDFADSRGDARKLIEEPYQGN